MATEQIFREMQHHLQTLQEALEALSTTVDEDKPTRDDVVVASRHVPDILFGSGRPRLHDRRQQLREWHADR